MKPPRLAGVVERRLLVNYRTDPEVAARLLPAPLRPQLVNGCAVTSVCMIRLGRLRPQALPGVVGLRSESAAHRIAVEWDDADGGTATGVYIPRRDSASLVNVLVGGRLFPGQQRRARFTVSESRADVRVTFEATDRSLAVRMHARRTTDWASESLFADFGEASDFIRHGARGYSATGGRRLDGLEMRAAGWRAEPVAMVSAESSLLGDRALFPAGSVTLDSALLMRDVPVTWNPLPAMAVVEPVLGGREV